MFSNLEYFYILKLFCRILRAIMDNQDILPIDCYKVKSFGAYRWNYGENDSLHSPESLMHSLIMCFVGSGRILNWQFTHEMFTK